MSRSWAGLAVMLVVGCQHLPPHLRHRHAGCLSDGSAVAECALKEAAGGEACTTSAAAGGCQEVRIDVPRQRVIVPQNKHTAVRPQVEHQQYAQTRQVVLVPQQVLVPFVQTTATGPVRVSGLSETQVFNVATASPRVAAGAAGVVGAAGPAAALDGQPDLPRGDRAAATAATASQVDCAEELRKAEERIRQMTTTMEKLADEVKRMQEARLSSPAAN